MFRLLAEAAGAAPENRRLPNTIAAIKTCPNFFIAISPLTVKWFALSNTLLHKTPDFGFLIDGSVPPALFDSQQSWAVLNAGIRLVKDRTLVLKS
jgi:hypothetical protein